MRQIAADRVIRRLDNPGRLKTATANTSFRDEPRAKAAATKDIDVIAEAEDERGLAEVLEQALAAAAAFIGEIEAWKSL